MEKESGIYKIEQISSQRVYIGSSRNMYRRCHRHMSELRHDKHPNIFLQRAFNKYGEKDFNIVCLEKCPVKFLSKKEQFYIMKYSSYDEKSGFNIFKIPYSSKEKIVSEETKNKMRYFANLPDEKLNRRNRMIKAWKDPAYRSFQLKERKSRYENPEFLAKRNAIFKSEEYSKKRSDISIEIWKNEKSREKLIEERRTRCTPEYKKKLSESAKKRWAKKEEREAQSKRKKMYHKTKREDLK